MTHDPQFANPHHLSPEHLDPDRLSALVDGELSTADAEAVQQHLAQCQSCVLRAFSAAQLKAATARAGQRFAPSPETLARLTVQLPSAQPSRARVIPFRRTAWAALAATLLFALALIGWRQFHQASTLSAELLDQHLATLSADATPQVLSSDRHTVKPWFQGKLPFSFNLPDPLPANMTLKGGDLTYLDGQPAALLLFAIGRHQVSVFLTQHTSGPTIAVLPGDRSGFSIRSATTADLRIVAVSNVNPPELDRLLSALVQAQSATRM